MGSVVICGGSMMGLCTAMMLAGDGHRVTVLEVNPDRSPTVPAEAWDDWRRTGVPQFRQPHNLFPRFRQVVDAELPGLTERLRDAGCADIDPVAATRLPPTLAHRDPLPGDDRFWFVTGRRPVVEAVVAATADEHPGVAVLRGVRVSGLETGPAALAGVPHVTGVRTTDGRLFPADLVVDAMGRRSPAAAWLAELGATPTTVHEADSGYVYYTRYFTGTRPQARSAPLTEMGCFTLLSMYGDNDTWSLTVFGAGRDPALRELRHSERFDRVIQACPRHAHWLDGRPLTGVLPMAGVLDRHRRFVVGGRPVVTGLAAVGDSWACTNPSAGRGLSVGVLHAQQLRAALAEAGDDPVAFALAFDRRTEDVVAPFVHDQLAADRLRLAAMASAREERAPDPPPPTQARFATAAATDPVVFRGMLETTMCLAPQAEVLGRPEVRERLLEVEPAPAQPWPGPDRRQLLQLLAG